MHVIYMRSEEQKKSIFCESLIWQGYGVLNIIKTSEGGRDRKKKEGGDFDVENRQAAKSPTE